MSETPTQPAPEPTAPQPAAPPLVLRGQRLVTADDVCTALEAVLREHLPAWVDATPHLTQPPLTWDQVPTAEEVSRAALPAGAVSSPGLARSPERTGRGDRWEATWRVSVAVWDRGEDHRTTSRKGRTWAALVRTVVLAHPTLGGVARETTWVDEDYRPVPGTARTLAQAVVAFDVRVQDTTPTQEPTPDGGPLPVVTSTPTKFDPRGVRVTSTVSAVTIT